VGSEKKGVGNKHRGGCAQVEKEVLKTVFKEGGREERKGRKKGEGQLSTEDGSAFICLLKD